MDTKLEAALAWAEIDFRVRDLGPAALRALAALEDAAGAYEALQDDAPDPRVGNVQPITVAEGNALNEAQADARAVLDRLVRAYREAQGSAQGAN